MTEELPLCECGCGKPVTKLGNRFIHGHNAQDIPNPHTSPAQIAADEAKRKPIHHQPKLPLMKHNVEFFIHQMNKLPQINHNVAGTIS